MEVHRIKLTSEVPEWQESFVTWLEKQEENGLGVEDGVFVAEVDPELRLKQQDEEDFIKLCAHHHLDQVDSLRLTKFNEGSIYHLNSEGIFKSSEAKKPAFNKFKEECSTIKNFKDNTCCTQILKEEGLEKLLTHLEDCADRLAMNNVTLNDKYLSKVMLEEIGFKMKTTYEKTSTNLNVFNWVKSKTKSPPSCTDVECMHVGNEEPNYLVDNELKAKDAIQYGYCTSQKKTPLRITSQFCLSRIYNLMWLVPDLMPGLHYSYIYFGTAHAFFSVHVEDGLLLSLNYLHIGHPKLWIVIPPWATTLLDYHLARSGIFLEHTKCRNLLGHKCLLPTVHWLKNHRIPFKIVVQHPGNMVILYPNAAHFGFNLGHNIAEAINIATKSWIPWGVNMTKCTCFNDSIHLKMTPLIAAFRPDLLPCVLSGQPVMTPQMVRGMKLLSDQLSQFQIKVRESDTANEYTMSSSAEKGDMLVCPALKCSKTFSRSGDGKAAMKKHVKSTHAPLKMKLLQKIEGMFGRTACK